VTTWPWKQNWMLLSRPLLVAEFWTTVKSIWPVKLVLRKFTIHIWTSSTCTIIFLKVPCMQFYFGI
jgi:hypothetical protein